MRYETDDGLLSCSNFPKRPLSYKLESYKLVMLEIEQLRGKIVEGEFELLRPVLNRKADDFLNLKRILVVVISSSTRSKYMRVPFPTGREGGV